MKKIKIGYVSHFEHFRMGGQKSMLALIEHLDRERFVPYAIVPARGELSERLEALGVKVSIIPLTSLKPKNFFSIIKNIKRIRELVRREEIDILHTDFERDTFLCGLAKVNLPVKLLWHVRLTRKERLDKINASRSDGIIGISEGTKHRFTNVKGIDSKFRKIFNGVDIDKFAPHENKIALRRQLGMPEDRKIILFVGQIKDSKGVLDILEAAALTKKINQGSEFLFLFIGHFENSEFQNQFQSQIYNKNIIEEVQIIGQQTNINEWMAAGDLLVLPSYEGTEGMGRVLFEAMACALPVIGTNISGVKEAITKDTGMLVNEHSPDEIAEAVNSLLYSKELYINYSMNARRRAQEVFDIKIHAQKVMEFYNDML